MHNHKIETADFSVEINPDSGFCFGVVNAIQIAENKLADDKPLYCVGDIVHNEQEILRLKKLGLVVIQQNEIENFNNETIIFRAHGEPNSSYIKVEKGNNPLIDATCPIVLKLQKKIKKVAEISDIQIVIYGKKNHPEVIGLMDNAGKNGICIESPEDISNINFNQAIEVFSQTTKSLSGFQQITAEIEKRAKSYLKINDTICRQVACRGDKFSAFAKTKDTLFFVGGAKSSNAKVLFDLCKQANPNSFLWNRQHKLKVNN